MAPLACTPSLQRLLALDKSTDTFGEQLQQAVEILRVEHLFGNFTRPVVGFFPQKQRFDARAEWVLKWLLGKLQTEGTLGAEARFNIKSWQLLEHLIASIPSNNAARLLKQHKFLSIIQFTLENLLLSWGRAAQHHKLVAVPVDGGSTVSDSTSNAQEAPEETADKRSRKRKRDGTIIDAVRAKENVSRTTNDPSALLMHVGEAIRLIEALSEPRDNRSNPVLCEQMKSALRGTPEQASRLLGFCMEAVRLLYEQFSGASTDSAAGPQEYAPLSSMLHIWESSASLSVHDAKSVSEYFSSECLVPATKLLATVLLDLQSGSPERPGSRAMKFSLEQLLARHVFVPARIAFFEARQNQRFSSAHEKASVPLGLLRKLLAPVMTDVSKLSNSLLRSPEDRDWLPIFSIGVSHLFDVALRCSSRSSPKKRIDETPWINGLYHVFTALIILPASDNQQLKAESNEDSYLNVILGIALNQKVVPATEHLRATLVRYSGLTANSGRDVQWKLVSQILELDANIFITVTSSHQRDGRTNSSETVVDFPALLFENITHHCWTNPLAAGDLRNVPVRVPDGKASSQFGYGFIRTSVVLPLMRAFAHARQLRLFIDLWRQQLTVAYRQRHEAEPSAVAMSVWEDDELAIGLEGVLEGSLTAGQILDVLDFLTKGLIVESNSDPAAVQAGISFANMVILDAVLSAVYQDETVEYLSKKLTLLQEEIGKSIPVLESRSEIQKSRIFRIICHLRDLLLPYQDAQALKETHLDAVRAVFPLAYRTLQDATDSATADAFLTAYEAFRLIAVTCTSIKDTKLEGQSLQNQCERAVLAVCEQLAHVLQTVAQTLHTPRLPVWDGRPQSVNSEETYLLAITSIFVEHPTFFTLFESEHRKMLLSPLCRLAAMQYSAHHENRGPAEISQISYSSVWEGLLDAFQASKRRDILEELLDTLCSQLGIVTMDGDKTNIPVRSLDPYFDHVLAHVAPSAVLRRRREAVLNDHAFRLRQLKSMDEATVSDQLGVMIRLMLAPNATAEISIGPKFLWDIAINLDRHALEPSRDIRMFFEELFRVTLSHLVATLDQERSRQYITDFTAYFHSSIKSVHSFQQASAMFMLAQTAIPLLGQCIHLLDIPTSTQFHSNVEMHLRILKSELKDFAQPNAKVYGSSAMLYATLEAVAALPLEQGGGPYASDVRNWEEALVELSSLLYRLDKNCRLVHSDVTLAVMFYRASSRFAIYRPNFRDVNVPLSLLCQDMGAKDRQSVLRAFRDSVVPLDTSEKAELISRLLGENNEAILGGERFNLLAVLISLIHAPSKAGPEPDTSLFVLLPKLSGIFSKTASPECFGSVVHCISVIIRAKQWLVTQYSVDTVLASIVATASPSGPALPNEFAGAIFANLCELMCSLLLMHRKKLGGRFHIVVPVLQTLLRCLYLPNSRYGTRSIKQPPWLSSKESQVKAEHASAYTRVLTALCDPTVSSVTTSTKKRSKDKLTDETKKAKTYAGQYVQYVIMEFCQCQLRSTLRPEVKDTLMPGLYAIMDVMTPEIMRTMNAAMDSSGRIIFKTLYDEWKRRSR